MKFLNYNNINYLNFFENYNYFFLKETSFDYLVYDFRKYFLKDTKLQRKIKKGAIKNTKKNSIKIMRSLNLIQKFIKLSQKKGNNFVVFKNINIVMLNFYNYYTNFNLNTEDNKVKSNKYLSNFINSNFLNLDLNYLIDNLLLDYQSIFEIKSKKNKNKKTNKDKKYTYEIIYIEKEKRVKYLLKSISLLSNSFKKYFLNERLFWLFFNILSNPHNSFLKKKKLFLNLKSIKFFKKRKN